MLMAGAPFGEPIVPYGPFVMNTEAEIQQAFLDLRNGAFVQNETPLRPFCARKNSPPKTVTPHL
jgi:hypothetical protein